VAENETEQELVSVNRELTTLLEQKLQSTLARIGGENPDSANGAQPFQPGATP